MIYFDHAASTCPPDCVWDAMRDASDQYGNVHRGIHRNSEVTTEAYEDARARLASFIGAQVNEVAFTSGTTASINLIARGLERLIKPDDEILVTRMEHHSNLAPWQALAFRTGAKLRSIDINHPGELNMSSLHFNLNGRTKIVAFPVVSNVLGTINPVKEIVEHAKDYKAITVADAAQSVAHGPTDVKDMGVDFLAFSGHKMYGPTGIGVLYGQEDMMAQLQPTFVGGGMLSGVSQENSSHEVCNRMFECGTPPILQAIGLGRAVEYILGTSWTRIQKQEKRLTKYAYEALSQYGADIIGPTGDRAPLISFNIGSIHAHDVAAILDEHGIAVRAGHHCAQPLHRKLGLKASVRASFSFTNLEWEIEDMITAIHKVHMLMKRGVT